MTSTVLDGVLCLLLISAAVVTVTTATPQTPVGEGRAPDVASMLATTTATVNYTLSPGATEAGETVTSDRTAHGTLAALLARAAITRLSVDGRTIPSSRDGFRRRVKRAVGGSVRANHTRITAVWRPYPESSITGQIAVGARPPPAVPIHAATLTTSSGYPSKRTRAMSAAERRGIGGVADVVAAGIVDGTFPPTRTRIAAGSTRPVSTAVRRRYHRTERLVGLPPSTSLADGGIEASNDRLAAALSDRIERDLHESNASARQVADAVRLGRVRITVRTWP